MISDDAGFKPYICGLCKWIMERNFVNLDGDLSM